jgi:hypothetical protein
MQEQREPGQTEYPHGRGYGHDYMRGGEVHGGYGYQNRAEYEKRRGEDPPKAPDSTGAPAE